MKKILGTLATIFGFFGLAVVAIFFAETNTGGVVNVNGPSLTADISANVDPGAAAVDTSSAPVAASTIEVPLPASSTEVDDAPVITPATPVPVTVLPPAPPLVTATPAPTLPPVPLEIPTDPDGQESIIPTSTIATATITVTPTAPRGPSSDLPSAPSSSAPAGLQLPYDASNFSGDGNWQTTWGSMQTTWAGFMDFSTGANSTGGSLFLKSSETWKNYKMSATLDWMSGKTIGIMGNYIDANDYVLCQYSKESAGMVTMQLLQYLNGGEIILSPTSTVALGSEGQDVELSIDLKGTYGTCSFNGGTISNTGIGPGRTPMKFSGSGGIGFTLSDPVPDAGEMIVKSVSVVGE
jgi:hypothetical protein